MTVLTNAAILDAVDSGHIKIEPLEKDLIGINSVNVRLGPDLWQRKPVLDEHGMIDLHAPSEWESVPYFKENGRKTFVLMPHTHYIGTTLESIGSVATGDKRAIVPVMKARSTTGRHGITIASCAGLGDVGYHGRWALEIYNKNDHPVKIDVGTEIGQILFLEGTPCDLEYRGSDRYQKDDGSVQFLPKPYKIL